MAVTTFSVLPTLNAINGSELLCVSQYESLTQTWASYAIATSLLLNSQRPGPYTVETLPSNPQQGQQAFVTDANGPSFLAAVSGGGSTVCPVFYNGSAWVAG